MYNLIDKCRSYILKFHLNFYQWFNYVDEQSFIISIPYRMIFSYEIP